MEFVKEIWEFIQNQVLGMQWLRELIGNGLAVGQVLTFHQGQVEASYSFCMI